MADDAVVISGGEPVAVREETNLTFGGRGGDSLGFSYLMGDYAAMWRTQPQIRKVVSFLARNISQLGLHVFERVSDNERRRVTDGPLFETLAFPLGRGGGALRKMTGMQLVYWLVADRGLFDNAFWVKQRAPGEERLHLIRIPPQRVRPMGPFLYSPEAYEVWGEKSTTVVPAAAMVHFRGYNPDDERVGVSPIEALRQVLMEDAQADHYREQLWRRGARMAGVIERPASAPEWSNPARRRFKEGWQSTYAADGSGAGGTPVLEDGMTWKEASFSARDSQWLEGKLFTREEVAAQYHIPQSAVGILEHATFSNITEQHKQLYQDCFAPNCTDIEADIALQLIPDVIPDEDQYVEFNWLEKLQGTFEEQARAIQAFVGAPIMTRNEGRARLNLPPLPSDVGDVVVTPLNVLVGTTQPASTEPAQSARPGQAALPPPSKALPGDADYDWPAKGAEILRAYFARQRQVVMSRAKGRKDATDPDWWDAERWDDELGEDLWPFADSVARSVTEKMGDSLGEDLDPDRQAGWVRRHAFGVASGINATTLGRILVLVGAGTALAVAIADVFDDAASARAEQGAQTLVTSVAGYASTDAAGQAGLGWKTWRVTSANPRPGHAALDGETVGIGDYFSNGARWPGDVTLDAEESAGCRCIVEFSNEGVER